MSSKEEVYDKEISPLMQEIIRICKENKINMAATFSLDFNAEEDSPLYCDTVLKVDTTDSQGWERIGSVHKILQPPKLWYATFAKITKDEEP